MSHISPDRDDLWAEIGADGDRASSDKSDKICRFIRSKLFALQLQLIDDPFRWKSLLCPRRAGKTYCVAAYLLLVMFSQADAECAFVAPTRTHAKRIIWRELKRLDKRWNLGLKFHEVELTATSATGSTLSLCGAETEHDIDKFRGTPFNLVVLDETASWPTELLSYLIQEVLVHCLRDRLGTLVVSGTPGALLVGDFYLATSDFGQTIEVRADGEKWARCRPYAERNDKKWQGVTVEWSFHSWTVADNSGDPDMWQKTLDDKRRCGWTDDTPKWIREGLGKWFADDSGFVFRYLESRNAWRPTVSDKSPWGLPEGHEWQYVAGVDLGYDDDFDIEVFSFSETCTEFYHVYGFQAPGMTVTQCADEIKRTMTLFGGFLAIICDTGGLGKQIFKEFQEVHGIRIEAAHKQDKRDWIEIFNADLIGGRCFVMRDSVLARQLMMVQWEDSKTKRRIDRRFPDHAVDAAIYARRFAFHYFVTPEARLARPGTAVWYIEKEREERARVLEERKKEQYNEWWESLTVSLDPTPRDDPWN